MKSRQNNKSGFFILKCKFFGITIYHALCNGDDCIVDINKAKIINRDNLEKS